MQTVVSFAVLQISSRVLGDFMSRCVARSVGRSIGLSALAFFGVYVRFLLLLLNCLNSLSYHCPFPPVIDFGRRVYGLVNQMKQENLRSRVMGLHLEHYNLNNL